MKKTISVLLSLLLMFSLLAIPASAANALGRSDFTYGGREIKGYKNFVPRVLEKGDGYYYFVEKTDACKNANRGINIGDNASRIGDKFGTAKVVRLSEKDVPGYALGDFTKHSRMRYSYKEGGSTFYKTFYIGWKGSKGTVTCVEYKNA